MKLEMAGENCIMKSFITSPSIIREIKSRKMRLTGYATRMVAKRSAYSELIDKPTGKGLLRRP
jgi:hypothetical protein